MAVAVGPEPVDEPLRPLTNPEQRYLARIAVDSIRYGLRFGEPLPIQLGSHTPRLEVEQACFVTLYRCGELRGCVGALEATRALIRQVAESAYDAGFRDGRLPCVAPGEVDELTIEISLLSALADIDAASERDLFSSLRHGIDGLVISEGERRATFLPKVWETFELPFDFVEHLKRKAGLPPRYWSPTLRLQRYTVDSFGVAVAELEASTG
jgi:AmmeMemoRadiSam system protein A